MEGKLLALQNRHPSAYVAVRCDINAKIGSATNECIGKYHPEDENTNGTSFRFLLSSLRLAAVNTLLPEVAQWTWTGSRGHKSRIDYIFWKLDEISMLKAAAVNRNIVLAESERDDHFVVVCTKTIMKALPTTNGEQHLEPKGRVRLSKQKLPDPTLQMQFADWVWAFQQTDHSSINDHLQKFQDHLHQGSYIFQENADRPRKRWISASSWAQMSQRDKTRRLMRSAFEVIRVTSLGTCFLAWSACKQ